MESNEYNMITATILGLIAIIIIALILGYQPIEVEMNCNIEGIELIDVRPDNCYEDFAAQHCPIPKNIDCSIKGKLPYVMVEGLK